MAAVPDLPAAGQGSDDRDVLLSALLELGASQRTIVVLRYWEDLSVAEVASLLNVAPGTVKSQAARGLERLRQVIRTVDPASEEGVR